MPALKSLSAAEEEDDHQLRRSPKADRSNPSEAEEKEEDPDKMDEDGNKGGDEQQYVKRHEVEAEDQEPLAEEGEEEDSKKIIHSSSSEEQSDTEYMEISLSDIRKDVQCPICLGIIRKTRTAMECLHRFCRECIDKSMRLGNNECPACRKHCASRRALRDDPNFDAFIATLFKNIDKFEEEEMKFHKDDEARKKQIQETIAQVSQRQSEALVKRKSIGKEPASLSSARRRVGSGSRIRRNCRNIKQDTSEAHDDDDDDSDDNDDDRNNKGRDSSSDEPYTEIPQRKQRRRSTTRPSSSRANNNDNGTEEAPQHHRDSRVISPGLVWTPEMLAWGRGGIRSNTRQGNNNHGALSRSVSMRNARLKTLLGHFEGQSLDPEVTKLVSQSLDLEIPFKLISLDTNVLPNLLDPYLQCQPTFLAKGLRVYVAMKMELKTEEVDLFISKGDYKETENPPELMKSSSSAEKFQSLEDDETFEKINVDYMPSNGELVLVYGKKQIE